MTYQNSELSGSISTISLLDRLYESNINGLLDGVILELKKHDTVEHIPPAQLVVLLFVLFYEYPFLLTTVNRSPLTAIFEDACNKIAIDDLDALLNQPNNVTIKNLFDFFAINCDKLTHAPQHDSNLKNARIKV